MDDKKNVGLYDNDLILDDGHDTPKELEHKHSDTMSLEQWRHEAMKTKAERDKQIKAGESKPPIERSKEDEDDFLKER